MLLFCSFLFLLLSSFNICQAQGKMEQISSKMTLDHALALVELIESKGPYVPEQYLKFKNDLKKQVNEALNNHCTSCYRVSLLTLSTKFIFIY